MPKLDVFFDYTCPFCNVGYRYLTELLPSFPNADIQLCPVEAHPRAEEAWHRPYVDLAVQGAYFIRERGGDELAYTARLFALASEGVRESIEDAAVLAEIAGASGADAIAFEAALRDKTYEARQLAANDYAYEQNRVWAVPTFVSGELRLDAAENQGVTREQLESLLRELFA
ncbi:MAG: hypothetical protein LBT36_01785 [Oscillospiraceae bacterium]|jgi:predicted DsbA family dithiol-disulfide isomerase|nr:hypothetical protein [Oscillospiraceae bacterium]